MDYIIIYSIICLASAVLVFSLGLLALVHYRSTFSAKPFGILMICAAVYAFGYGFEIMKGDPGWVFLWLRFEYMGLAFIAACSLWLALVFTRQDKYLKPAFFAVVFVISLFFLVAVFTNNIHHLFYTSLKINHNGPFQTARLGKGVLYIANFLWQLFAFAISVLLYIRYYFKISSLFKKQTLIMIIGASGTLIDYVIYMSGLIPWDLDSGPIIITINGCIIAYGIFRKGLLDISPIAREKIFESMREGVVVTDLQGIIVDFNTSAQNFLVGLSGEWIGKSLLALMPQLGIYTSNHCSLEKRPFRLENAEGIHFYEIRQVPIFSKPLKEIGTAWYLRRITEEHQLLEKLKNYAEKDELTGIWNRRKWMEFAKAEIAKVVRYKRVMAIMLIDIDHFKSINDSMGHEGGDRVLVSVTNTITAELRECDIFGRVGGEEFGVILPETNIKQAAILSERLLQVVSQNKIDFAEKSVTVTVSGGIAVSEKGSITSLKEFMSKADNALYEAKKSGRNKVCFAEPSDC